MKERPAYLTIKDLDRTLAAHGKAAKAHEALLDVARVHVRAGIEAYVEARLKSPDHRMTDNDFERLLGALTDTWNNIASEAANEGYISGRIPGFRLGFELAGLINMGCTPELPYIAAKQLPTYIALAMVEDIHAGELVKAMLENKGECEPE